ncbi:MAG: hypothetical protein WAO58_09430 [Fimbriimonadaceae bacterium]
MSKFLIRAAYGLALLFVASLAQAGTLEVSSPTDGAFVGRTNTINFIIRGATLQVTVKATATGPGGTITSEQQFTPDVNGEIEGSLPLNFAPSVPEGAYTIVVTATEPGNTYNDVTIVVTLDVTNPKFLDFNPISGSFVRGIVAISVFVNEPNVKEMRIQVNNQDIPNNETDQDNFTVLWDTAGIEFDGPQTITIKVKDKANNESTQTIDVVLDRVSPVVTIQYPRTDSVLRRGGNIPAVIEVRDKENSVHAAGVDVILVRMDNSFITRVARTNFQSNGDILTWSGRIRWNSKLPSTFKMRVNAVDKAGNVATMQEVVLTVR